MIRLLDINNRYITGWNIDRLHLYICKIRINHSTTNIPSNHDLKCLCHFQIKTSAFFSNYSFEEGKSGILRERQEGSIF